MGEHDSFWSAGRTARCHDEGIPLRDRQPVRQAVLLAVGGHHAGRSEGGQQGLPGRSGQAGIERCHGVAGVPDGPQRIDEAGAPREVECNEFRHWR